MAIRAPDRANKTWHLSLIWSRRVRRWEELQMWRNLWGNYKWILKKIFFLGHPVWLSQSQKKSKNFPDSKIFVAKTFRMKRINCINFQIHDKCAERWFCKILYVSMVQICSLGSAYNRGPKLSLDYPDTFLNYPDTFRTVRKLSRSPRHISRSSWLFLDYLDTYSRLSGHCLDRTETFQIIHTFQIM